MYAADTALIATSIGNVLVTAVSDQLTGIAIDGADAPERDGDAAVLREAARQLRAYFAGRLECFDLPLAASTTTRGDELRAALVAIPHGQTITYGALARLHGSSARAIGGVCRTNRFPIVVPCHRVVSTGRTEYYSAGAGPETKAWLLTHERAWKA